MENRENTPPENSSQENRPQENLPKEDRHQENAPRETGARESRPTGRKNIWNLILGIIFLGYGSYRLYVLSVSAEGGETLSYILAIAFVIFGLYDLWKYYKGL